MEQLLSVKYLLYITFLSGLLSCTNGKPASGRDDKPLYSQQLTYAKGFSIDYFKDYKRLIVYNPWQSGQELERYYLTSDSNCQTPLDGRRILTPVRSIVSGSCTHYAFLDMLGVTRQVTGICEARRVYNPSIRQGCLEKRIADLGDPFRMNVERCLMLKPELVMISGFNQYDENAGRLSDAGIPVVFNNEWMEQDLLARAEWIRYIACFFEKEALADSLFRLTEQRYRQLVALTGKAQGKKPLILSGDNFRGTWYQPGGRSFTAQLFRDAGGRYIYHADTTRGSIPLSFEQVYKDLAEADVWVGATNGASLKELQALDQRYTLFRPFREGNVYAYTNRITPEGGNDFWEGAVARPDLLLADFICLFHPELLPGHEWTYLKKLK